MVAVVEATAEFGVEIGAAAPARMTACLVKPHLPPRRGKFHGSGKPGEAGADDICPTAGRPAFHTRPWRRTSQSFKRRDRATRAAGSRHSPRNSWRKVAR